MTSAVTEQRTYTAKAVADKSLLYGITYAPPNSRRIYYFVLVDPRKERAFLKELESAEGSMNLTYFGTIVAAGYGEPSDLLKNLLQERYHTKLVPFEAA